MKLRITITQKGIQEEEKLKLILDKILSISFIDKIEEVIYPIEEKLDEYGNYELFDSKKWIEFYLSPKTKKKSSFFGSGRNHDSGFLEILLNITDSNLIFSLDMDYELGMDHEKVKDFFIDLYRLMPGADVAYVGVKEARDHYLDVLDAPNLPPAFNNELNWIQIVNPVSYKMFDMYRKEDILKAPAYLVEELEDDFIYMESYSDPFAFESDGDNVLKLANYLLSKAKPISL